MTSKKKSKTKIMPFKDMDFYSVLIQNKYIHVYIVGDCGSTVTDGAVREASWVNVWK